MRRTAAAAQVARHEVLFEAFVSAFMKFASEKVYCSGQTNMLYQPEFADINKLREVMKVLEDSSLFSSAGQSRRQCRHRDRRGQ